MSRIRKRLPSPAMIVAIVALMAASAGTSFAAIGLSGLSKSARHRSVSQSQASRLSERIARPNPPPWSGSPLYSAVCSVATVRVR